VGVIGLLALLRCHSHSGDTQAAGCSLLVQLLDSEPRKSAAAQAGAIEHLVSILRCHATNSAGMPASVLAAACLALVSLASASTQRTTQCVESGALVAVIGALRAHPQASSPLLALNGCMMLVQLLRDAGAQHEARCQMAAEEGALVALVAALSGDGASWPLLTWATIALLEIMHTSALRTQLALKAGAQEALEKAIAAASLATPAAGSAGKARADNTSGKASSTEHHSDKGPRKRCSESVHSLLRLAREWLALHADVLDARCRFQPQSMSSTAQGLPTPGLEQDGGSSCVSSGSRCRLPAVINSDPAQPKVSSWWSMFLDAIFRFGHHIQ